MNKKEFNTLGVLEAKIMKAVWSFGNVSVRNVLDNIKTKKKPAYTTVMTVMTRLCEKKVLKRKLDKDTYIYTPVQEKKVFLSSNSKRVIHNLISEFGEDIAVAGFIDVMKNSDVKKSKELRKRLKNIIG